MRPQCSDRARGPPRLLCRLRPSSRGASLSPRGCHRAVIGGIPALRFRELPLALALSCRDQVLRGRTRADPSWRHRHRRLSVLQSKRRLKPHGGHVTGWMHDTLHVRARRAWHVRAWPYATTCPARTCGVSGCCRRQRRGTGAGPGFGGGGARALARPGRSVGVSGGVRRSASLLPLHHMPRWWIGRLRG